MRIVKIPRSKRVDGTALLVAGATLAVLLSVAPATPALSNPANTPSNVSLTTAGATTSGEIPDGTCSATVTAIGGGGGANFADPPDGSPNTHLGGDAANISVRYAVHPGQDYRGSVGGRGEGGGTSNSGGAGPDGFGARGGFGNIHAGAGGGGTTNFYLEDLTNPAIAAGGGGGSGGGHWANGMNGGDAGVPNSTGTAAAGQTGGQGRDLPALIGAAYLVPGAQGGQTNAAGAGANHPRASSEDGADGSGPNGGQGRDDAGFDAGGGGGGGYFGGGGGASTVNNGGGGTSDDPTLGLGGSGGGGGSSFIGNSAVDVLDTPPVLISSSSATGAGAGGVFNTDGNTGSLTMVFGACNYDLAVTKTASPAYVEVGDTITWTVEVINNGPDPMTRGDIVTLTDTLPGAGSKTITSIAVTGGGTSGLDQTAFACDASAGDSMPNTLTCGRTYSASGATGSPSGGTRGLDSGETLTVIYTEVANAADANTTLDNTAAVSDRGGAGDNSDDASVLVGEPDIALSKTISHGPVSIGDGTYDISYSIVATNIGGTDLQNVVIDDDLNATFGSGLVASAVVGDTCASATLTPSVPVGSGDSCQIDIDVRVAPGTNLAPFEFTNLATVSAASPRGTSTSDSDSASVSFSQNPAVSLTKAVTAGPANNQDGTYALSYTMVATNTGDINLDDIVIDDDLSATFGAALVSSSATSNSCAAAVLTPSNPIGAGDTCQLVVEAVVRPGPAAVNVTTFTNTATVIAESPADVQVSDDASADATFVETPAVSLTKSIISGPTNNGDGTYDLTYSLEARNIGDVSLDDVTISDDLIATFGGSLTSSTATSDTCPGATLAPSDPVGTGDTCVLVLDVIVTPGTNLDPVTFTNNASVVADSPSDVEVTSADTATTSFTESPAIAVQKGITSGPINNADGTYNVTYEIVATNTGDIALENVIIDDDLSATFGSALSSSTVVSNTCAAATLQPSTPPGTGDDCAISIEVVVTPEQGDVNTTTFTNDAVVTANSPGGATVTDSDSADVLFEQNPEIELIKSITSGPINNGDGTYDLTYRMVVTNVGDIDIFGLTISDDLLTTFGPALTSSVASSDTCPGEVLEPSDPTGNGDSCELVLDVVVTPGAGVNTTTYTNTASADGTAAWPAGVEVSDVDSVDILFSEAPAVSLTKEVLDGPTNNQDGTYSVTYLMIATNTGDVDLTEVTIDDDLGATFGSDLVSTNTNSNTCLVAVLEPSSPAGTGDSCRLEIDVVVNPGSDDVNVTDYLNSAVVTADSPGGNEVTASDDASVAFDEAPAISLVKTITAGPTNNEDGTYEVTYEIVATNTGDVSLRDVAIDDDLARTFGADLTSSTVASDTCGGAVLQASDPIGAGDTCELIVEAVVSPGSDDINTTDYENTASVTAVSPAVVAVSANDSASTTFTEAPAIIVVKEITDGPVNNQDGTYSLTYQMVATNTGDVNLASVSIDDDLGATFGTDLVSSLATSDTCVGQVLRPSNPAGSGDTCELVLDVVVRPGSDDINSTLYRNTAVAEGDSPTQNNVNASDDAAILFVESPSVSLNKSVAEGPINNGDGTYDVAYQLVATNTGDVPLANVIIDDDLNSTFGSDLISSSVESNTCESVVLAPSDPAGDGDSCEMIVVAVVDPGPDDINATTYTNNATVTADSPSLVEVTATDFADVMFTEASSVELVKTITSGPTNNQDGTYSLTYRLVATNTGDININNVTIDDDLNATFGADLVSATAVSDTCNGATLIPSNPFGDGTSCELELDVVVSPGADDVNTTTYTNTATVTGNSPTGANVTDTDTASTQLNESPSIDLTKTITNGPTNNGDGTYNLTYLLTATNTGDVTLNNITINDDLNATFGSDLVVAIPISDTCPGASLDASDPPGAGDSCELELSVVVDPGPDDINATTYTNNATVTADSPADVEVTAADSAEVMFTEASSIELVKTITSGPTNNQDGTYSLTYRLVATNTGDININNVTIDDDLNATFGGDFVSSDTQTNTCLAATLIPANPFGAGTSCEVVLDVVVSPGADDVNTTTYTNTATVTGNSPTGANVTDTDTASTQLNESPSIDLTKTITNGPTNNGDGTYNLTYLLTATNTGDVTLNNITINDDLNATFGSGLVSATPISDTCSGVALQASDPAGTGESCELELETVVAPSSAVAPFTFTNNATVAADSPADVEVTAADAASTSFEAAPSLDFAKRLASGPTNNQDGTYTVTYEMTVINTGDVTLSNVTIDDDLSATFGTDLESATASSNTCPGTTLEPSTPPGAGDSCELVLEAIVRPGADDVNVTTYTNTATVLADAPSEQLTASDQASVSFNETPGIDVVKAITSGPTNNFDGTYTVVYEMVATNTGNVTLSSVVIDDDLDTTFGSDLVSFAVLSNSCAGTVLVASDPVGSGESCELVLEAVVNPGADDINVTAYRNDALATADSPAGVQVSATDSTSVVFQHAPAIDLIKTIIAGPENNQDGTYSLTYEIIATNTGDVNLASVEVADDLALTFGTDLVSAVAITNTCSSATLAPSTPAGSGDQCELLLEVLVNPGPDDVNVTSYRNEAEVTADSPYGTSYSATDDAEVTFVESPAMEFSKSVSSGPTSNGDGTYLVSYRMVVTNTGDVALSNVVIDDDLEATFDDALVSSQASTNTCAAAELAATGSTDETSCELILDVVIAPGSNIDPFVFSNNALASSTSPAGVQLNELDSADASFVQNPQLSVTKDVVEPPGAVSLGDGSYLITYRTVVSNTGDVVVNDVQLTDDLAATFGGAVSWQLNSASVVEGACTSAANRPYDGQANVGLLEGTDSLAAGESCIVEIFVTVTPGAELGPYSNSSTGSGTSPSGIVVDVSNDGTVADPDGDGPQNDSTPTTIWFTEGPQLSVTKQVLENPGIVAAGDGTYQLTYEIAVANSGDVQLDNLQIDDDFNQTFAEVESWSIESVTVASGSCTALDAQTLGDTGAAGLLEGNDSLGTGESCTIRVGVGVTPGAKLGPHENSAVASGRSPGSELVSDVSQNGQDPDPDRNNDPTDNSQPTPVQFPIEPVLALAKDLASAPSKIAGSQYQVSYRLVVSNEGDAAIAQLQIRDDLAATFSSAERGWEFVSAATESGACTVSPSYDGQATTALLTGTDTLDINSSCQVLIVATVDVGVGGGTFANSAVATGSTPNGFSISDTSQSGAVADPDNNGDPTDNNTPTTVTLAGAQPPPVLAFTGGDSMHLLGYGLSAILMGLGIVLLMGEREDDETDSIVPA